MSLDLREGHSQLGAFLLICGCVSNQNTINFHGYLDYLTSLISSPTIHMKTILLFVHIGTALAPACVSSHLVLSPSRVPMPSHQVKIIPTWFAMPNK